MVVRVDGEDYVVKISHGSKAHVRLADGSTHQCKRNNAPGTHRLETELEMQTRVQRLVKKLNAEQERTQPLSARLTLGSPALCFFLFGRLRCDDPHHRSRLRRRRRPETDRRRPGQSQHARSVRRSGPAAQTPSPTRRPRLRGPPTRLRVPSCRVSCRVSVLSCRVRHRRGSFYVFRSVHGDVRKSCRPFFLIVKQRSGHEMGI